MKNNTQSILKWRIFKKYTGQLVAGVTTRYSEDYCVGIIEDDPFSSFNMGLHVGDNIEKVIHSRKVLCQMLDFPFEGYTCANQIHGESVVAIDGHLKGSGRLSCEDAVPRCDALITNQKGILLNIFVADCVPIVLYDPIAGCCGVVHAGWRGVASALVGKTVAALQSCYNSDPSRLLVGLGPSIGLCCFDVKHDTVTQILGNRTYSDKVLKRREGRIYIDLRQCLEEQLKLLGIDKSRIEIIPYCTKCSSDIFYSYRASNGKTGRFAGFIGLR